MSKCKNLYRAEPGMKVFYRFHPHADLFTARILDIVQEDTKNAFKGDIVVRIASQTANEKGYYDVVFIRDGRQREGEFYKESYKLHSIYPIIKKYKAICKLEKKYANDQ